jgi:hypothetical protein
MECHALKKPIKRKIVTSAWLTPEYITAFASLLTAVRPYLLFVALALLPLLQADERQTGVDGSRSATRLAERGE